jgi:hypothetical protein
MKRGLQPSWSDARFFNVVLTRHQCCIGIFFHVLFQLNASLKKFQSPWPGDSETDAGPVFSGRPGLPKT